MKIMKNFIKMNFQLIKQIENFKDEDTIKNDHKNYCCKDHIKEMEKYCFECKKNIFDFCEKESLNEIEERGLTKLEDVKKKMKTLK